MNNTIEGYDGERSFDDWFKIGLSKGMSKIDAVYYAQDRTCFDYFYNLLTEDAEFEIIQPKQIQNSTTNDKE